MGMDAHRCKDFRMEFGQFDGTGRGFAIHTNRHQADDTGAACVFDYHIKVPVVAFVIEMTMTVKNFHV
jgi:hypothetical protein